MKVFNPRLATFLLLSRFNAWKSPSAVAIWNNVSLVSDESLRARGLGGSFNCLPSYVPSPFESTVSEKYSGRLPSITLIYVNVAAFPASSPDRLRLERSPMARRQRLKRNMRHQCSQQKFDEIEPCSIAKTTV